MSEHELQEWMAYEQIEGLPVQRNAYGHAVTAAAASMGTTGKFDPEAFLPSTEQASTGKQSTAEMKMIFAGLNKALEKRK